MGCFFLFFFLLELKNNYKRIFPVAEVWIPRFVGGWERGGKWEGILEMEAV